LRPARLAAPCLAALCCALWPVRAPAQLALLAQATAVPQAPQELREPQTVSQEAQPAATASTSATSTADGAISRPAQEQPGTEQVRRNQTLQRPPLATPEPPPPPPPAAPVDTRPRVLEVKFEGAEPSGLRALVPILDGAPLDTRDVRDAVRALHASARFSQVSAWAEPVPEKAGPGVPAPVRVVFVLTPVQRLLLLTFSGHKALADSILHQTANLQANAEYRPELVARAIEAIKQAYNRVGHRDVNVTPKTKDVAGGVQLELAIDEGRTTRLGKVEFTGDLGLSHDELLAAFKLDEGDVLNLGLVDEGVKGLRDRYREAGRLRARVEAPVVTEMQPPGTARLSVPVQAGPHVSFHVRGNGSFSDELLATKLRLDGDEPLDAQAAQDLAQRLRRFYVQAGFYEVKVLWREIASKPGEVEIVFSIDEGPRVRVEQLQFLGTLGVPTGQLRERVLLQLTDNLSPDPAFGADPGELARRGVMGRLTGQPPDRTKVEPEAVYDPVLYARAIKQIEDLYKSLGYLSAKVGPARLEPLEGVNRASKDSVKDAAKDLPRDGAKDAAAQQGAKTAQFPLPARRMKVIVPIDEGDRSIVSQLVIEGGNEVPAAELDAVVKLTVGGPFSYYLVEEGRSALAGLFTRRGYFYAKVEDEERFLPAQEGDEPGTARVEVRYRIQAGSIVRVGYVEVVGQRHTQEQLIRDLVKLQPGDVLSPEGLDKGQQALLLTGLFFSATLTPRNPDVAEPEKTVLVQVRERPRKELQTSFGYSIEDGPRASATFTYGNLFGRNLTFTALARANFPYTRFPTVPSNCTTLTGADGQVLPQAQQTCDTSIDFPSDPLERLVDLGFAIPRLQPFTDLLRLNLDFIHERAIRPTYQLTKYFATQLALTLNQAQPLAASLTYEVGYQVLSLGQRTVEQELAGVDSQFFRQQEGKLVFSSLRPLVTVDLRDDLARPRKGLYVQLQADWIKSLYSPTADWLDVKLIKLQGLIAGYVPLPAMASLVVSARGGRVYKLDGDDGSSTVPGDRRFYLGGATTLRGFHQDAVQPQDVRQAKHDLIVACANVAAPLQYCSDTVRLLSAGAPSDGGELMIGFGAELRIPVSNSVELALFWDAGNLWAKPANFTALSFTVLRQALGVGLRYLTPIGRIAVDLGFNLSPDIDLGDPRAYPYFAIDSL
jgi:outer membrane protein assembly factor BamA